ncbi:MAG TPA: Gfo/Idh/MocA family oxidoreductase [Clostridiales bacterium]|nr:Gfo/Idh/MocA family oxidoreductase [Clostridiales bacterium]HRT81524.1 Gfo/Idh/MocA family oxidoreductase [Oscillospiraceae bacterium]
MEKKSTNFGVIGLSGRGIGMMAELMNIEGVNVVAVCDVYEDRVEHGAKVVEEKCGKKPEKFLDYKKMLERDDIAAVMCCTTWITHARIAVDCMRAGKHVGVEVGGAASIEECWQMVRASEETGKFCMLLENCCYDRNELALFNMQRQGLFGEIVHAQGGYLHDLREEILQGRENRHGRLKNFMNRNGDVYPTHQLGPIAKMLGINRGNRFLTLTSMASKARGLNDRIKKTRPEDHDLRDYDFTQGDIVTTMIKCAHGETVLLTHSCTLPRPYSRGYQVQGTNGIWIEDGNLIHLEGMSPDEAWESFESYREKYEHPLWRQYEKDGIRSGGHGGMDYLILCAFAESAIEDVKPPIDVYDTAVWMSITCLSEQSVALGSAPVAVPDFTNGAWIEREEFRRGKYCLEEVCEEFFE